MITMKKSVLLTFLTLILPLLSFAQEPERGFDEMIDAAFKPISDFFSAIIFFNIGGVPFVLMLLVFAAAFFHYHVWFC